MFDNSLIIKETGQKVCEREEHCGLIIMELNAIPVHSDWSVNTIVPRYPEKVTTWIWRLH